MNNIEIESSDLNRIHDIEVGSHDSGYISDNQEIIERREPKIKTIFNAIT